MVAKAGYGVAKDMLAKDGHSVESMEKLSKLLMDKVDSLRVTCHRVDAIAGKLFLEPRTRTMARHIEETSRVPDVDAEDVTIARFPGQLAMFTHFHK